MPLVFALICFHVAIFFSSQAFASSPGVDALRRGFRSEFAAQRQSKKSQDPLLWARQWSKNQSDRLQGEKVQLLQSAKSRAQSEKNRLAEIERELNVLGTFDSGLESAQTMKKDPQSKCADIEAQLRREFQVGWPERDGTPAMWDEILVVLRASCP